MHWNPVLETGIPLVDSQHRMMFDRLDVLLDRQSKHRVSETLDFLGEYVLRHFGCEEMMMKCSNFPDTECHTKLHKAFAEKYMELKREYEHDGEDFLTLMKLTRFVQAWLQEHIMTKDKEFAEYFKAQHYTEKCADLTTVQHSA